MTVLITATYSRQDGGLSTGTVTLTPAPLGGQTGQPMKRAIDPSGQAQFRLEVPRLIPDRYQVDEDVDGLKGRWFMFVRPEMERQTVPLTALAPRGGLEGDPSTGYHVHAPLPPDLNPDNEVRVGAVEPSDPNWEIWVDTQTVNTIAAGAWLPLAGGNMTGEIVFMESGEGITFYNAARIYRNTQHGLMLREGADGKQPSIEDQNGTNQRPIIDQASGDARYSQVGHGHPEYALVDHEHPEYENPPAEGPDPWVELDLVPLMEDGWTIDEWGQIPGSDVAKLWHTRHAVIINIMVRCDSTVWIVPNAEQYFLAPGVLPEELRPAADLMDVKTAWDFTTVGSLFYIRCRADGAITLQMAGGSPEWNNDTQVPIVFSYPLKG